MSPKKEKKNKKTKIQQKTAEMDKLLNTISKILLIEENPGTNGKNIPKRSKSMV